MKRSTTRKDIEAIFPLSAAQQGMLFETAAAPGSGLHVEQMACRLVGKLDVAAFEGAWRRLVARHQALRASFVWKDQEEPVQVVLSNVELPFRTDDWRRLEEPEQRRCLETFLEEDRRRGFELSRAPLLRVALLRVADEVHHLVWTHHHILMDGWCQPLVWKELMAFYAAETRGEDAVLEPVRPYRDYIAWLRHQDPEQAESFWRRMLAGFARPTPLGRPAPALVGDLPGQWHEELELRLSAVDTGALQDLARSGRVTLNTLVQGAWALLLGVYSSEPDVVFGITVAGRPADLPGIESTVGLFINTLPLRLPLPAERPLCTWLQDLQELVAELRQFESTPVARIRRWAEIPAASALFESVVVFENYPMGTSPDSVSNGAAVEVDEVHACGGRTGFALTLVAIPGNELALRLVYDRRRVVDGRLILDHTAQLLRRMPSSPREPLRAFLGSLAEDEIPLVRAAPARAATAASGEASEDPIQEVLAALWADVLGVERLGVEDDFFQLGGHSLVAAELVTRVREAFQVELPLRALFEARTVARMASDIARRKGRQTASVIASLPPITPDPERRHAPFPLTDVQHAYWVGRTSAVELGNVSTHNYWEIEGAGLDLDRLVAALRRLISRHDMLRAIVDTSGQQRVLPEVPPYEIPVIDLRYEELTQRDEALRAQRNEMSHQVLPSDRWPLFDIRATRLPNDRIRLHIGFDLLIADGWSFHLLGRELALLYRDPGLELPPLELSFRDCVLAEQALRGFALYERDVSYWKESLADLPPAPELPLAVNPVTLDQPRFKRRGHTLDRDRWRRLKRRATSAGLTPSALLLAVFSEVLAAWSKSPRFSINLTLFNRLPLHEQIHQVVGDFTSLTLLAVDVDPGADFTTRARRLQERLWEDLDHRLYSGVQVLRELARGKGGPRRAFMPVVFTSTLTLGSAADHEAPVEDLGIRMESVYSIGQTPQVWLDHQVSEQEGVLYLVWDAVEDLFPAGLLDEMFGAYLRLVERLVDDDAAWNEPGRSLVPSQQLAVRARVNATRAPIPEGLLHAPFLEQAAADGDRPAVITPERTLSYSELDRRSLEIATKLRQLGARPNQLVAIVMEKGWEQVVAAFAILRAGAAYLPIDASLPAERRKLLLQQGESQLAITQPRLAEGLEWPSGITVVRVDSEEQAPSQAGHLLEVQRPEDLAYVIFTSGSTGQPKGVMIDHRGALNTVADVNRRFGVGADDRVLGLASLSFDLSVYDLFGLLGAGGTLVLPEPAATRDPARWAELIASEGVTIWNSVPVLMEMLVEHVAGPHRLKLASLRLVMLSGDWIPVMLPDRIREARPDLQVVSLGGATEASIWSILHPIDKVEPGWTSIPYGKPMTNQTFHVLDAALQDRPVWVPGELFIGGVGVAKGYWKDGEKTAARFIRHPRTGERLYRTGDLGRFLPDGTIEFLGREDFQVKIQGHRIELGEIEAVLERHPAVRAGVVQAVGEDRSNRRLVAYVVPKRPLTAAASDSAGAAEVYRHDHDERGRPAIDLGQPTLDDATVGGVAATPQRRLAARPLSFERFGEFLASLMQIRLPGSPLPKYRYPSAGSLYPVQTYVHVKRAGVEGVPAGVYYYHPGHHRLVLSSVRIPDRDLLAEADQPVFDAASFAVYLVGELRAVAPAYGDLSPSFCLLEAGYMAQLLAATGRATAIGLWPADSVNPGSLHELVGLGETQLPVHCLLAGPIDPAGLAEDAEELVEEEERSPEPVLAGAAMSGDLLRRLEIRPLRGATELLELKMSQPGVRAESSTATKVALVRPDLNEELIDLFRQRRSEREFSPAPIRASEIGDLLALVSRSLPSGAAARHRREALRVYLHVKPGRVDGLAGGIYLYDDRAHRLVAVAPDAELDRSVHGEVNRPVYDAAAFSLFLVAGHSASSAPGRAPLARDLLDAGAIGQLLMSLAPRRRIGLCPIGTLEFDRIRPLFELAQEEALVHSFLGGRIDPQAGQAATVDEAALSAALREHLQAELPGYMVPSAYVLLSELPLSANGKVDRKALPSPSGEGQTVSYAAPRNALEQKLAEIFKDVLQLDRIGIHDDFFDTGGNSLLAIQAVSKIRQSLGLELSLGALFEGPTVAQTAALLQAAGELGSVPTAPRLEPVPRDRELPLSYAQQRLWFLAELEPESPAYNMPSALHLAGELDAGALEASLNEIVRRHEVLRTTFAWTGSQPVQVIHRPSPRRLPIIDLESLPAAARRAQSRRLAVDEAHQPFDLVRGPLLRFFLIHLAPAEHVLLVTMHHIASDVWSLTVFLRELTALHAAFSDRRPSPLPELAIQYADFALWQRQWLEAGMLEAELAYWRRRLAPPLPVLHLPTDRSRSHSTSAKGSLLPFRLPEDLSAAIAELGASEDATLFMTLLAAFDCLLYRLTGQTDLVVGTDLAGRNRSETESMIGFFVNMLALRVDLSGTPTFRELLRRVRLETREAFRHQDLPLGKLVEEIRPDRDLSHSPLFRVLFVLQNVPAQVMTPTGLRMSLMDSETETSKFDLSLFMNDKVRGLKGTWVYNTDLFEAATVERFARQFEVLVQSIVDSPDSRLDVLKLLTEEEQRGKSMEQAQQRQKSIKMFKAIRPKSVARGGDLVEEGSLEPGRQFPTLLRPAVDDLDLADWVQGNKGLLRDRLAKHGAILLRGFGVGSEEEFERVASALCPDLFGEYGDLPQTGKAAKVYESTPYPPDKTILFHNESSHMHRWPLRQFFFCVTPARARGETPIVDCREIYLGLRPELRDLFAEKELLYVRNFVDGLDVSWKEFFRTDDREAVEEYCANAGIDYEWTSDGLRTEQTAPAVAKHPDTGEMVFFNQIQLHHAACLDEDLRKSLTSLFGNRGLPRNVLFGDRSPIPDEVVLEVLKVYWDHATAFGWQAGDILAVDNMLVAHARNPYEPPRKIAVAMGEMFDKNQL